MTPIEKLRDKLTELFQLDQADLDFGIYRIMNAKRKDIVKFLDDDLLPQVEEAFAHYKSADKVSIKERLEEAINQARSLGVNPDEVAKVIELRAQYSTSAIDVAKLQNEVFSHLYSFFSRYYDDGDFISQRRYKEGVYAIPYEGEEVKLYWANHDQYYIKTAEHFRDYSFKLPDGQRVQFKITEADTEKDNVKATEDKDRRFIYTGLTAEGGGVGGGNFTAEGAEIFVANFEYRADEEKRTQVVLTNLAATAIIDDLQKLATPAALATIKQLTATWHRANGEPSERTVLEKHLNEYTKRNTFDYFIHKNLGKFLRRELDFYIKNEVMHLDDIEHETAPKVEQYLSKIKVIRAIAHKIIQFLAQLEDFQKKLWLKKKFVVETNYCITLDRVPEELYSEIAANEAQREEWVRLYAIDEITAEGGRVGGGFTAEDAEVRERGVGGGGFTAEDAEELQGNNEGEQKELFPTSSKVEYSAPLTVGFLKDNPYLMLDTKFFNDNFKSRLSATIDDFDEQCNGLLIHSENFQALRLMQKLYKNKITCIHIDPPYNTTTSGFLYKNNFRHSSWISFIENRISESVQLLNENGSYFCHIDENEYENLFNIFERVSLFNAGTIVWDKRNPMNGGSGVANQHEYIIARTRHKNSIHLRNITTLLMLAKAKELIKKHEGVSEQTQKEFSQWVSTNKDLSGGEKAYRYLDEEGNVYQSVSLRAPEPRIDPKFHIPLTHPVTGKPCAIPPNGFSRTPETLQTMIDNGDILFGKDETTQPRQKVLLTSSTKRQMPSLIQDAKKGKSWTDALGLNFPYCHPVSLYEDLLGACTQSTSSITLDFFGGSGTTTQAILNLNNEDDYQRKYILVEMGDHFDTVLKPRLQKVVYSAEWKDGKPVNRDTGISHMFKYIRLESYEDALANLQMERSSVQELALESSSEFRESYMLSYMLDVESRGSASLLNLDRFNDPFSYKLLIGTGSVGETKPTNVDLVETFNWLLGLKVKHIDTHFDKDAEKPTFKVVEGTNPRGEKVLVIWRRIKELDSDDKNDKEVLAEANKRLDEFFKKCQYNTLDMEFDLIYVNGDNNLMNLPMAPDETGQEPGYKVRLIEEEFKRLMFDVQDV